MRKPLIILTLILFLITGTALAMDKEQVVRMPTQQSGKIAPQLNPGHNLQSSATSRTDLVNEGFEGTFPPDGWSIMTSGESFTWVQTDAQAYSGMYCAWLQWGDQGQSQDEWLITPAMDTTGFNTLFLEFMETGFYWASYGFVHEILVSTTTPDDPANFTSIWQVTPGTYEAPWLDASGSEWGEVSLDLGNYIGETIYIALRYEGEWADDWWIDDFRVFEPFEHDVKALSVVPDGQIWLAGQEVTPQFTIKNIGSNVESFNAEMEILHNGEPFYFETVAVADLGVGEEIMVDFPAFIAEPGSFDMTGIAALETDLDPDNNTATAGNGCFTGERTPLGMLFTEWGCPPCVAANQAFDAWYPMQGNESSLIRVHVWWPAGDDPMYHANAEQVDFLHANAGVDVWGVPCLLYDNTEPSSLDASGEWSDIITDFHAQSAATAAPLEMEIYFDEVDNTALVMVDVVDPMPGEGYYLYVAVTEDNVYAPGPNGEEYHSQAFRWLYPGIDGLPVGTDVGLQEFTVPLELDEGWNYDNLRATAFVMQLPAGMIQNSATMFLTEGSVGTEDNGEVSQDLPNFETQLSGAHPNPFNPMTWVHFSVAREQLIKLSVFDMAGKRVAELSSEIYPAGEHRVLWDGKNSSGQDVSSGTYMIYMETDDAVTSSKMTLVR